ncbi:MAG TPA: prepilin-type N-terminal cleavage/methylation domain-containing protein [Thermoleophilaceae bacterium]|jgi:prepilin-type N-terminal cleavage/methylation domain-containing protein
MPKAPPAVRAEQGFTLVEVTVAIVVLLVGVMGVLTMANGASSATTRTKAHEAANALARDMIEATHALPYANLTAASATGALQARPGLADSRPGTAGWQLERRGVTYTVTVRLCVLDDAKDGAGAHDSAFCPDTGPAGTADVNPNDYKRLSFELAWTRERHAERVVQSTLVMNSDRGPAITALNTNPAGATSIGSGNSAAFTLTTAIEPAKVEWYLDGAYQQDLGSGVSGSGTAFAFTWNMGSPCSNNSVIDGTYVVSAQAFNAGGSTPGPRALTMRVNRCAPVAPTAFSAGRNRWGVELNWEDSKEDDVAGYRVHRGIGSAPPAAIASGPCSGVVRKSTCIEPDPAPSQSLVYNVRAVDRDPSGALRDGTPTVSFTVVTGNRAPATPAIGNAQQYGTIGWYAVTDPDRGDAVDFYRIYRDGQALANRYDVIDAVGDPIVWTDADTGGIAHTYYVVAVDTRLAESGFSNAVTR